MTARARSVKAARLQAHVAIAAAHAPPQLEEDVRRVVPKWTEVLELVEGARKRGWTESQMDYLTAVVGVTWSKAFKRGHEAGVAEAAGKASEP
jgi:hypothetical protein